MLKSVQIIVAFSEDVDAVRCNNAIFFAARVSDIFPLLRVIKHGIVSGKIEPRVKFDRSLVFPIMCPVVLS